MKTKIALASKAKPNPVSEMASKAEQKQIADAMSAIFGVKPEAKAKQRSDGLLEYTWNKSSGQVYFSAEGQIEVYIDTTGMPRLEFTAKNPAAALTRLKSFAEKVANGLDKQIAALKKRQSALRSIKS